MIETQRPTENSLLARARASQSGEDCIALYEEWAEMYNRDVSDTSQGYVAPIMVAQAALKFNAQNIGPVLDAGCGTGLVGEALAAGGVKIIDGLDLSSAMLKVAGKTGVYRNLVPGDLTQQIAIQDDTYGMVTCAGTFTHGHVGPDPALKTFVRLVRNHGIIIATVLNDLWESAGFKAEVERLESENIVKVISAELKDYRKGQNDKAIVLVLEKTGSTH